MNDLMIKIDGVSLKYRLARERPGTLQEFIVRRLKGKRVNYEDFWALRDINLEVRKGETLGLIGPNGAGKSTLLKVVAGILIPVQGELAVNGKIAPLIELGAGFNAELIGKENIYLNSAILGLSRKEIDGRFGRILEFSELGEFIYSPLKSYSSGMVARLGFSIATEVDPDILIIDEILSVGDEHFRNKCDARIKSFKERGVTILFVSHSMNDIKRLCDRAVCLEHGKIAFEGNSAEVVDFYVKSLNGDRR
ncbi:MAG: ABC transporter ATP-binding protein [Nitrospirae bacterium]|nr:ABC transporter ATP-binding protein [Nitrospirota bacterium]